MKKISFALIFILALTPAPQEQKNYNPHTQEINKVKIKCEFKEIRGSILEESYKSYKIYTDNKKNSKKGSKRVKKVNEEDIYLLGKLIYCEVGNIKDDRCLELCGSVVLNRMQDKRYPSTLQGVIFQKGQYEVTWNGHWSYKEPDKRCLRIARKLLKYGSVQKDVNAMSERVWGTYYCRFDNVIFSIC